MASNLQLFFERDCQISNFSANYVFRRISHIKDARNQKKGVQIVKLDLFISRYHLTLDFLSLSNHLRFHKINPPIGPFSGAKIFVQIMGF